MIIAWLAIYSAVLCICDCTRTSFINQVNVARILSWRDMLHSDGEKRWTCKNVVEEKLGDKCLGEDIEQVVETIQRVIKKANCKVIEVEGLVIFGQVHEMMTVHLSCGMIVSVRMCLGKVCGPIMVYEDYSLIQVGDSQSEATWTFHSRLVESVSYVENNAEISFIILSEEGGVSDLVLFGKYEGCVYYEAMLEKVKINNKFARPVFRLGQQGMFNMSHINKHMDRENFWYKNVKGILSQNKTMEINVKKRQNFENRCPASISKYVSKYGLSEESFISTKIIPNLPLNMSTTLNCSNIFQTIPDHTRNRTGFVSFPGSGALWIRLMLEMVTGLNTAIHMTEPHKDGGSLVTMSHHTDLHPDNKDVGQYLVDPPRR